MWDQSQSQTSSCTKTGGCVPCIMTVTASIMLMCSRLPACPCCYMRDSSLRKQQPHATLYHQICSRCFAQCASRCTEQRQAVQASCDSSRRCDVATLLQIRKRAILNYFLRRLGPLTTTGCDHGAFLSTLGESVPIHAVRQVSICGDPQHFASGARPDLWLPIAPCALVWDAVAAAYDVPCPIPLTQAWTVIRNNSAIMRSSLMCMPAQGTAPQTCKSGWCQPCPWMQMAWAAMSSMAS